MKNSWALMQRCLEGPAWRWKLAQKLASTRLAYKPDVAEALVRDAAAYLRRFPGSFQSREDAAELFPLLFAAEKIANDPPSQTVLKIMALANCSSYDMAARLNIDEEAIRTWEKLFFDVRENLCALDWIVANVLNPEKLQDPALAAKLRLAFVGGPVAARAILGCDSPPYALGDRLMDRKVRLMLKADQALAMPLTTSEENFRFVKFYSNWRMEEKKLELAVRRLEHRCAEALRKHERALERDRQRLATRRAQEERFQERAQEEQDAAQDAARARAAASPLSTLMWATSSPLGSAPALDVPGAHPAPDPVESIRFPSHITQSAADEHQAAARNALPA